MRRRKGKKEREIEKVFGKSVEEVLVEGFKIFDKVEYVADYLGSSYMGVKYMVKKFLKMDLDIFKMVFVCKRRCEELNERYRDFVSKKGYRKYRCFCKSSGGGVWVLR